MVHRQPGRRHGEDIPPGELNRANKPGQNFGFPYYGGFPRKYQGAIFSAQHGSWNRTVPVGARVMLTYLKEDGTAQKAVRGRLARREGEYLGRPVDVAQLRDGSILVSDDFAGVLYRIWYDGK